MLRVLERQRGTGKGEGLDAKQQLLLYPLGMLSEGRGGSVDDACVSWKVESEQSIVRVQTVYYHRFLHHKHTVKEEHSVLQLHIENYISFMRRLGSSLHLTERLLSGLLAFTLSCFKITELFIQFGTPAQLVSLFTNL